MSSSAYWSTPFFGNNGGTGSSFGPQPQPITSFTAWWDDGAIIAHRVDAPGPSTILGTPRQQWKTVTFAPGEQITCLSLEQVDGNLTHKSKVIGRISIWTDKGNSWFLGPGGSTPKAMDIKTLGGFLVGFEGAFRDYMDNLILWFLQPLKSVSVAVQSDTNWQANSTPGTIIAAEQAYTNELGTPNSWTYDGLVSVTNLTSFTQSATETFDSEVAFSVSAPLFEIVTVGVTSTFKQEKSNTTSQEATTSTTVNSGTSVIVEVPPKKLTPAALII